MRLFFNNGAVNVNCAAHSVKNVLLRRVFRGVSIIRGVNAEKVVDFIKGLLKCNSRRLG